MTKNNSNPALSLAFQQTERALNALQQMVEKPMQADRSNIDACIQRFEFTIELFWKLLRRILEVKGLIVLYPKDVLRAAYSGHLIEEETLWLSMLNDRNQTSHTYDERLADAIYQRIKMYFPLLLQTYKNLSEGYRSI